MSNKDLPDIQNEKDTRGKGIERVGVKKVKLPLLVSRKDRKDRLPRHVNASVNMFADVVPEAKGVNMSRFLEVLMEFSNTELTLNSLEEILNRAKQHLTSNNVYIQIQFPYFIMKTAPVSGKSAPQEFFVTFIGRLVNDIYEFAIQTDVYVTNCCPCSKEISFPKGAHNQRARLTVKLVPNANLWWVEDIIQLLESQGSCEIFPLLKRPDEKYVTEHAYDNPKFVEDLVRDLAIALEKREIEKYSVKAEAEESIHIHNAVAYITKKWNLG